MGEYNMHDNMEKHKTNPSENKRNSLVDVSCQDFLLDQGKEIEMLIGGGLVKKVDGCVEQGIPMH